MKGMFGFIIQDNTLVNSVQIQQEVKQGEKYLVQFLNDPTFSRVVSVEEIQTWLLFQNQQMANNWLVKNQPAPQTAPPPPPPQEETPPPPQDETPPPIEDQLEDQESPEGNGQSKDNPDELCIHGVNLYKEYCDQGQCHAWTEKYMAHLLPKAQEESEEEKSDAATDES